MIYIVKNAYLCFFSHSKNYFEKGLQSELSCKAFRYYLSRPYSYYLRTNSAEVLHVIATDIQSSVELYSNMNYLISDFLTVIIIATYLLLTDCVMAIGVILISLICFVVVSRYFKS